MIIDYILDRKCNEDNGIYDFNARDFYNYVSEEESIFSFTPSIAHLLDTGTNKQVQKRLCEYIDNGEYNPAIKDYVNSKNWIMDDTALQKCREIFEDFDLNAVLEEVADIIDTYK